MGKGTKRLKRRLQSQRDKEVSEWHWLKQNSDPFGEYREFLRKIKQDGMEEAYFARIPESLVDFTITFVLTFLSTKNYWSLRKNSNFEEEGGDRDHDEEEDLRERQSLESCESSSLSTSSFSNSSSSSHTSSPVTSSEPSSLGPPKIAVNVNMETGSENSEVDAKAMYSFIGQLVKHSRFTCSTLVLALFYLDRIKSKLSNRSSGSTTSRFLSLRNNDNDNKTIKGKHLRKPGSRKEDQEASDSGSNIKNINNHNNNSNNDPPTSSSKITLFQEGNWGATEFFIAILVADKYLYDSSYNNESWAKFTQIYTVQEVNQLERQFLRALDYELFINEEDYLDFLSFLEILLVLRKLEFRSAVTYKDLILLNSVSDLSPKYAIRLQNTIGPMKSYFLLLKTVASYCFLYASVIFSVYSLSHVILASSNSILEPSFPFPLPNTLSLLSSSSSSMRLSPWFLLLMVEEVEEAPDNNYDSRERITFSPALTKTNEQHSSPLQRCEQECRQQQHQHHHQQLQHQPEKLIPSLEETIFVDPSL